MPHYTSFTFEDWSREKSTVRFFNGAITAVSIAGYLTAVGQLRDAIEAVTYPSLIKETLVMDDTILVDARTRVAGSKRELKWLVTYRGDTSGKLFQAAIPYANDTLAGIMQDDSDFMVITSGLGQTLVTEIEDIARTPDDDTETVTVVSIRRVGRNL